MNNYIDITDDELKNKKNYSREPRYVCEYIKVKEDGTIIKYDESNAKFDKKLMNKDELRCINLLRNFFDWNIQIIKKINIPEGIRCPDIRNISSNELEYWDIKCIYKSKNLKSKKNKVSHAINSAKGQTHNIIIDGNNEYCDLDNEEIIRQLNSVFNNIHYKWINKIIIFGKNGFVRYFKRK